MSAVVASVNIHVGEDIWLEDTAGGGRAITPGDYVAVPLDFPEDGKFYALHKANQDGTPGDFFSNVGLNFPTPGVVEIS